MVKKCKNICIYHKKVLTLRANSKKTMKQTGKLVPILY